MMQECLREQGYSARAAATMKEALAFIEAEPFDWLLLPTKSDHPLTYVHLLAHAIRSPHLRGMRVSLLAHDVDRDEMLNALSLGCLSWHPGPFTKTSFSEQMQQLSDRLLHCGFMSDMVSACYVRDLVDVAATSPDHGDFANRIVSMEKALVRLHPGNLRLLMESAKSCRAVRSYFEALVLLRQASLLEDPKSQVASQMANEIQAEMARAGLPLDREITSEDIIGVQTVAVIEPDSSVQRLVERYLREAGVSSISLFSDGKQFMDWAESNDADMVIMEWKLPRVSAAKILQRLSLREGRDVPLFVVVSSSLTQADMPLLREFGVASVISKPFGHHELMSALLKSHALTTQTSGVNYEHKIRSLLRSRKVSKALEIAGKFLADPTVSGARKMLIQADIALASKDFETARDLCLKAMTMPHDALYALQILGKSFMRLRQFDYAMKCFDKAQVLSPMNVERICLMAESEAERGHDAAAREWVETARLSDEDNPMVRETEVNVAVTCGDVETAARKIGDLPNIMSVVAFQNNRAVAMAKSSRFTESVDIYKQTLKVLPEKSKDARDTVLFNLALSHVKMDDLKQAVETLDVIGSQGSKRVAAKAVSLRTRIGDVIRDGGKLILKTDDPLPMASGAADSSRPSEAMDLSGAKKISTDAVRVLSLVDFKPGDLGCFQILTVANDRAQPLDKVLNGLPPVKIRWRPPVKDPKGGGQKMS